MNKFEIQAYTKKELALLYFPSAEPHTAVNRLMSWVKRCKPLHMALIAQGYKKTAKWLSPREVAIVVEHLGEPWAMLNVEWLPLAMWNVECWMWNGRRWQCWMWNVECGMVGDADVELLNEEWINSTLNTLKKSKTQNLKLSIARNRRQSQATYKNVLTTFANVVTLHCQKNETSARPELIPKESRSFDEGIRLWLQGALTKEKDYDFKELWRRKKTMTSRSFDEGKRIWRQETLTKEKDYDFKGLGWRKKPEG